MELQRRATRTVREGEKADGEMLLFTYRTEHVGSRQTDDASLEGKQFARR